MNCALIHSAGQNSDGSMTENTRESCRRAIEEYDGNRVMFLFIDTDKKQKDRLLADEMLEFLRENDIDGRHIICEYTAHNPEEELLRCEEWLRKTHGGSIENIVQIFHNTPSVMATV